MAVFWAILLWANYALAIIVAGAVLLRRKEPVAMTAWILAILFIPFGGMLLYWMLGSGRLARKVFRRRKRAAHLMIRIRDWAARHALPPGAVSVEGAPSGYLAVEKLAQRVADMPATAGNEVQIYTDGLANYDAVIDAIRHATRHIHIELYIWRPDATGTAFRNELLAAARRGVECRVLLDAVGNWDVKRSFTQPLIEAGVQLSFFLPIRLFSWSKRWSIHLRNHRKIIVVDGQIAFTGSANIGDEYLGRVAALSPWHDAQSRVVGPAALFLQQIFAEDWALATRELLDRPEYFPEPPRPGASVVQVLPSGPDQNVQVLAQILFAAVTTAERSIRIVTPYFVPDAPLRMALEHAALRGLKVRIVLPTRSDAPITLWAARSFYAELMDFGVEIYEYDGGMLHAKAVVVDEHWCLLGSANMDVRSFRLNYEISAAIYDPQVVRGLSEMIDGFCEHGRRITRRSAHQRPLGPRMLEGAARLLAPLL